MSNIDDLRQRALAGDINAEIELRAMSSELLRPSYTKRKAKVDGPFTVETIREMAKKGLLHSTDFLSESEDGPWEFASKFSELRFETEESNAQAWNDIKQAGEEGVENAMQGCGALVAIVILAVIALVLYQFFTS